MGDHFWVWNSHLNVASPAGEAVAMSPSRVAAASPRQGRGVTTASIHESSIFQEQLMKRYQRIPLFWTEKAASSYRTSRLSKKPRR